MIQRLTQADHERLYEFLLPEKEINLFILGDIENFGYDHPRIRIWADCDDTGQIRAVVLCYYNSLLFYSRGNENREAVLGLMREQEYTVLSGQADIVKPIGEALGLRLRNDLFFCRLARPIEDNSSGMTQSVQQAGLADVPELIELLKQISEFPAVPGPDQMNEKFNAGSGRVFMMRENGRIVSVAQSTAECRFGGMIVGVATLPAFRRRGYASACMIRLCAALQADGKAACLFYDNPAAGSIYKRLGFKDIGRWMMFEKA